MSFNYNSELKKFEKQWQRTARFYAENGMPKEKIDILHDDALKEFNRERIYQMHNQSLTPPESAVNESGSKAETLLIKRLLPNFVAEYDTGAEHSRYWWIEEIGCQRAYDYLHSLTKDDLEILTLYYFDKYTVRDIAWLLDLPYCTLTRKIARMEGNLRIAYLVNLTK